MPDWRCPECNSVLTPRDFSGNPPHVCPQCGREFLSPVDAETVEATASIVGAGRRGGRPQQPGVSPGYASAGGEGPRVFRGRTIYMRLDNANDGTGCCGCGCLLLVLFFALALRACIF